MDKKPFINPHFRPLEVRDLIELKELKTLMMERPSRWKPFPYSDVCKEITKREKNELPLN